LHDFPFALDLRARAADQLGEPDAAQVDRQHLRALAAGSGDTARTARRLLQPQLTD
jgi:hypothetical protein